MVFSSIVFILYFLPLFLICYYLAGKTYKNLVILVFSILFYSWGAPKFIFVILATTFLDFHLVKWMDESVSRFRRKTLLILSLSLNLGLLFYFKYFNFFIENVNVFLEMSGMGTMHWAKLILPIGISFYTFESITYVVDVYRRIHKPLHNFWDYQTYIILFPKLIAGPIIRYHELADQITDRSANDTYNNRLIGFYRFAIGLAKKVIIANHLGAYADEIFAMDYMTMHTQMAWAGILAYTFQIYFDFSGYSDMAIGIGKMIGFKFPENFNNPYVATSITDFWRRWHITLGNWMRNYLYIPLGGNKVSAKRLYFNLWIVFLASGLWHGASWSFIIWGAYHGLFLVLERSFLHKVYQSVGSWFSIPVTFLIVVIGWVFFRIEQRDEAIAFLKAMFSFQTGNSIQTGAEYTVYLGMAFFFSFITLTKYGAQWQEKIFFGNYNVKFHYVALGCSFILVCLSVSMITSSGFNPFIYFRF